MFLISRYDLTSTDLTGSAGSCPEPRPGPCPAQGPASSPAPSPASDPAPGPAMSPAPGSDPGRRPGVRPPPSLPDDCRPVVTTPPRTDVTCPGVPAPPPTQADGGTRCTNGGTAHPSVAPPSHPSPTRPCTTTSPFRWPTSPRSAPPRSAFPRPRPSRPTERHPPRARDAPASHRRLAGTSHVPGSLPGGHHVNDAHHGGGSALTVDARIRVPRSPDTLPDVTRITCTRDDPRHIPGTRTRQPGTTTTPLNLTGGHTEAPDRARGTTVDAHPHPHPTHIDAEPRDPAIRTNPNNHPH